MPLYKIYLVGFYALLSFLLSILPTQYAFTQTDPRFEMSYFEDVNSTYTLETVKAEKFEHVPNHVISLGIIKSTVWVKIKLDTSLMNDESVLEVKRPFLDNITLSYLLKGNIEVHESLGLNYPSTTNKFNHFLPVFAIPVNELASQELYLKINSRYSMLIPISVSAKEDFYKGRVTTYLIAGILIGGILLMALYNLFLYFSTKDFSYVIYVFSIIGAVLSQGYIYGILIPYLSPNSPEFSFRFPVIIMALTAIFGLLFAIRFLDIKKLSKRVYYLLVVAIIFELFSISLELLHLDYISRKVNIIQVILFSLIIFSTAVFSLVKGQKIARYFTIGWSLYLFGMIVFALKTVGILPHNSITSHFMHFGTFMEVLLLSFALGHKYALVKQEKERLERQTVAELEVLVKIQTSKIENSLKEKELLMKEIHHRVKNNMQMVSSVLQLKSTESNNPSVKKELLDSQSRILSMSLAHKKMYEDNNFEQLNVSTYLKEIISTVFNTQKKIVSFDFTGEDLLINIAQGQAIGFIIHELASNSIKHAWSADDIRNVKVSIQKVNGQITLTYADNGKGVPPDFDIETVSSMGLKLVRSFTKRKLKGHISFLSENGTTVILTFKPVD